MGKTFAHATLISATVLTAFMIMGPIAHLSAQNEVKIDEKLKVRKATIEKFSHDGSGFTATLDEGVTVPIVMDASTTIFWEMAMKRISLRLKKEQPFISSASMMPLQKTFRPPRSSSATSASLDAQH